MNQNSNKRIVVDFHRQVLMAYEGEKKVFEFDCVTGDSFTPTDIGIFKIEWKDKHHVSSQFHSPMPYSMFFKNGKAIHGGRYVPPRSYLMNFGVEKIGPAKPIKIGPYTFGPVKIASHTFGPIKIGSHEFGPIKIGSHGCVNLTESNAQRLFDWAPVGTLVQTIAHI